MWEGNCSPERLKTKANDEKENISQLMYDLRLN